MTAITRIGLALIGMALAALPATAQGRPAHPVAAERARADDAARQARRIERHSGLLAAVAVGIAARGFAARHLDACALMRWPGRSSGMTSSR